MVATLAAVAARSAEGSRLAATYITPEVGARGVVGALLRRLVAGVGEPFEGFITVEEMATRVERAGLVRVADTDARDWAGRYARWPVSVVIARWERMVLVERRVRR